MSVPKLSLEELDKLLLERVNAEFDTRSYQ